MEDQRENIIREKFSLGQLREGLVDLINQCDNNNKRSLHDNAQRLLKDYETMLDYVSSGAKDPKQPELWSKIYDEAYKLVYLYEMCKAGKSKPKKRIDEIPLSDYESLFKAIENNFPATKEERKRIQEIILNDQNPLYLRGMVLSALTLNLLNYFDIEKFESLYTYTLDDQPQAIRQRAWVAIALVTMANDHHISTQPRLVEQMKFICEEGMSKENNRPLLVIQYSLYQCLQALKACEIMKNEIEPEMKDSLNMIRESIDEDDDIALQWTEYMKKSGIHEKIQNFINLQQHGIDILFESFSKIAAKTPFFAKKYNWLMPFDLNHPLIKPYTQFEGVAKFFKLLNRAGNMCSTDKYSNTSVFTQYPVSTISNIKVDIQIDSPNPEDVDLINVSPEDEINGYLHDLFRYFFILIAGDEEDTSYNPFTHCLYFNSYSNLAVTVKDMATKQMFADLNLNNNDWEEAMVVLEDLLKTTSEEETLQKYIYANIKVNKGYQCCLDIIAQCNTMYPGCKWTMMHYAKALAEETAFYQEEQVLREACRIFPEEVRFTIMLGKCLIDQERYSEAIEQLCKADLMKEKNYRTLSLLAEAALWVGNKELAEKQIERVLKIKKKVTGYDWMNAGHLALIDGNMPLALKRYRKAGNDFLTEMEYFERPRDLLLRYGVSLEKINLAFEVINRELGY